MTGLSRRVSITNQRGLHARAAAKIVKLVAEFEADVRVAKDGTEVSGNSIMGLMMLAAAPGTEILLRCRGPQADDCLAALVALIEAKFYESE
jgi:phosphocarrier protein